MKSLTSLISIVTLAAFAPLHADLMVVTINGAYFEDAQGNPVDNGSLFQLVNLGSNRVFDAIAPGSWVGGDDRVIDLDFNDDFPSAAAFDISGSEPLEPGFLGRNFVIEETPGVAQPGDAVGLRWFPDMTPGDYYSGNVPLAGSAYGEVTVVTPSDPINYTGWVLPVPDLGNLGVIFDSAISPSFVDTNPEFGFQPSPGFSGSADLTVAAIPEPAAASVFVLFMALLVCCIRKFIA